MSLQNLVETTKEGMHRISINLRLLNSTNMVCLSEQKNPIWGLKLMSPNVGVILQCSSVF